MEKKCKKVCVLGMLLVLGVANLSAQGRDTSSLRTSSQEGRPWLVIGELALSLSYYDLAVPLALEMEGRRAVGTGMIVAGLGFGIPFFATQKAQVSYAQANLAFHFGALGIAHGYLLNSALELSDYHFIPLLFSLGENIGGYTLAYATEMSAGTSQLLFNYGWFGLYYGMSIPIFLELESSRSLTTFPLLGSLGGTAAAWFSGRDSRYSYGDALASMNLGSLGGLWGVDIYSLFRNPEKWDETDTDSKLLYLSSLIGHTSGLLIAHNLAGTRDMDGDDGWMLFAATYGGGLFAGGLTYLFGPEDMDERVFSTVGLLGSSLSFFLTYRALQTEKRGGDSGMRGWINPYELTKLTLSLLKKEDYSGSPLLILKF